MTPLDSALRDLQAVTRDVVMGRPRLADHMIVTLEALRAVTPAKGGPLLRVLRRAASEVERDEGARRTFFHASRALAITLG